MSGKQSVHIRVLLTLLYGTGTYLKSDHRWQRVAYIPDLARAIGARTKKVRKALNQLEEAGLIRFWTEDRSCWTATILLNKSEKE